jgi:heat shock protein HtpX
MLREMDEEEVEGVIAHELAHVKNRDILISSVAATIAGAVGMIAHLARWGAMFGGMGGRHDERGETPSPLLAAVMSPPSRPSSSR